MRRLVTIERFLNNQELNPEIINNTVKKIVGDQVYWLLRQNEVIDDKIILNLRIIIKNKLVFINKRLNGKK